MFKLLINIDIDIKRGKKIVRFVYIGSLLTIMRYYIRSKIACSLSNSLHTNSVIWVVRIFDMISFYSSNQCCPMKIFIFFSDVIIYNNRDVGIHCIYRNRHILSTSYTSTDIQFNASHLLQGRK